MCLTLVGSMFYLKNYYYEDLLKNNSSFDHVLYNRWCSLSRDTHNRR